VANDGRQNKPSIKINRGDDAATAHTAEFYTARIRQIEYESAAEIAKDTSRDQQVSSGRGGLRSPRVDPGHAAPAHPDRQNRYQFSVVWDPGARKVQPQRCGLVLPADAHQRRTSTCAGSARTR
jgi:hypothetical protein